MAEETEPAAVILGFRDKIAIQLIEIIMDGCIRPEGSTDAEALDALGESGEKFRRAADYVLTMMAATMKAGEKSLKEPGA